MTAERLGADPSSQADILDFLLHAEPGMRRVDTHASIVFLGKDRVLKIKRAVRLPFLDYSTLALRHSACEEELRVNQPFARQIYRGVIAITRDATGLMIDGDGEPVEWAVEMARFDEMQGLDRLAAGQLAFSTAIAMADSILAAHARQPPLRGTGWADGVAGLIQRNTDRFRSVDALAEAEVDDLDARSRAALTAGASMLRLRSEAGFVRRCHGDLHLGNIVLIDGRPVLFDAIEFDPAIATTDILYDLAFPLMDLLHYGNAAAANVLFNRYIQEGPTDNLDGLALLPLFLSMRAAVRAHVLFTKNEQKEDTAVRDKARRYFDLAIQCIKPAPPCLIAIGGLSGTGKSVLARGIAPMIGPAPGALVLRSDVIRKKQFGVGETERLPSSTYTPEASARVYDALLADAARVVAQGHSVILDAAFLRKEERASFSTLSPTTIPHIGVFLTADRAVRIARIAERTNDASDATVSVAVQQEAIPLGAMDWHAIDAGGSCEQTLSAAGRYLRPGASLAGEET